MALFFKTIKMRKNILIYCLLLLGLLSNAQVTITPSSFNVGEQITISVNLAQAGCNTIPTSASKVYMHAGIGDNTNAFGFAVVGNWGQDDGVGLMTNQGGGIWSITITPSTYFNLNTTQQANATRIGIVLRNATGSQEMKKTPGCTDFVFNVGVFQANLTAPAVNSTTIINSGGSLVISANNTNGPANYNLKANGVSINTLSNVTSYNFTHFNISSNQNYELDITQGTSTQIKKFSVVINPGTIIASLPAGLENGINYGSNNTIATLVLEAPEKDFVYVAGSFNNWQPTTTHAMKKDPTTGKFWLELTGLTAGQVYNYQYWVVDQTPLANSPAIVKTADPCSTLVLSPFDDSFIPANSFAGLTATYAYPAGQEREVTVLQTGQVPYNWQTTNFTKPNKDNLVVYELLVRDFDANRNYQDVINKITYLKNLGINAVQLMPVMEYEGNESWGYNTSFHMALDKFYGTKNKLKELVDVCHQNGIAVILDIAFNHAFGRNPMVRMWMNDPDGDGWGTPSTENPYFNTVARHSYSVGEDFNHTTTFTREYVKQTIKHWITDFKIDGFRWDLTKGFTQNCTASNETCTNAYQQDRVDVLKEYADYSWSLDPDHYVIFEHLGSNTEEQQWANYRLGEGKGIMMWGEMFNSYKQLALGYASSGDISGMGHLSRGFTGKRLIGYPESHDKDRLMYEAITFGASGGTSPVNGNLTNALNRMTTVGATSILVPGPKMIWHFQELGMDDSIYTCSNGTVNTETDAIAGNCKLDTKPQPQWVENWLTDPIRGAIYQKYSRLIKLKTSQPVFNGSYTFSPESGDNLRQRIYVFDNALPNSQLKNVVVLGNFSTNSQNITPNFPYTGTWYDLMDDSVYNVTNVTTPITIPAGQFRVFGNQPSALASDNFVFEEGFAVYPNPAKNSFSISQDVSKVELYTLTGQKIRTFENVSANKELNIQDLQSGIYLIKAFNSNADYLTKKLIKE